MAKADLIAQAKEKGIQLTGQESAAELKALLDANQPPAPPADPAAPQQPEPQTTSKRERHVVRVQMPDGKILHFSSTAHADPKKAAELHAAQHKGVVLP